MLKWSVTARRNGDKTDGERPQNQRFSDANSPVRNRRRHSEMNRRRISLPNRKSLSSDEDKENQFTSTPIKSLEDLNLFDPFRDVSNLTPKKIPEKRITEMKVNRRASHGNLHSVKDTPSTPVRNQKKPKKRKSFLTPFRDRNKEDKENQSQFFKHFETVDSHIGALPDLSNCDREKENVFKSVTTKRKFPDIYAPTLPTFTIDYSPSSLKTTHCLITLNKKSPSKTASLIGFLNNHNSNSPQFKRPKIDHVNDFLHQISFLTSPEEKIGYNLKQKQNNVKISPLVKKFVDLGFSKQQNKNRHRKGIQDSSFINDLSLNDIVDAILDETDENYSDIQIKVEDENKLNETHEENLINEESEKRNLDLNSSDKYSVDSGFKSTTNTENSHQLDGNFKCKCNKKTETILDKTILDLKETFNERCVDVSLSRKRPSTDPEDSQLETKRVNLGQHSETTFALKRQKCIRRRRTINAKHPKQDTTPCINKNENVPSLPSQWTTPIPDEQNYNDNSFESSVVSDSDSDKLNDMMNILEEDVKTPSYNTPITNNVKSRSRKCLLFESPKESSKNSNEPSSIELNIQSIEGDLIIHVIKASKLKNVSSGTINSYVKVYMSDQSGVLTGKGKQRTAVQANSRSPIFNHIFKLKDCNRHERLHVDVWHRDRTTRTSEFLGCTSFSIHNECQKELSGSFQLLSQSTGKNHNIPITSITTTSQTNNNNNNNSALETKNYQTSNMCDSHSTSIDEMISLDEYESVLGNTNKSILNEQQKSADENLFLRYLELDPLEGPDAIPAATQRRATGIKNGRTPFTHTKRLVKCGKSGFGFSVVWTHPPRIERVEKGLPADRAGILPGDYIIFVDKHNVVMMPEIDILNLIKSFGNTLTLEIFRRNSSRNGSVPSVKRINSVCTVNSAVLPAPSSFLPRRPSTVCSTNATSTDYSRRKLQLPQVAFNSEKTSNNPEENRKRTMYQLINREQQYATSLQFAVTRFVSALAERKDLITPSEHKILFQNSEEILRIAEDVVDSLVQEDGELQINSLCRTYLSKIKELCSAYKRYCSGIKKADCILANKMKNTNSDFYRFLHKPEIPRRRPDITSFIHKPLEHYREILKLLTVIQSLTSYTHEDYSVINHIVQEMQVTYREITSEAGLMEPTGGGRPLLTVQDLENRLVFTKCKPFALNKPGRQWIFGSDLSRVEGRNIRQYWTLLFSDLLLFAKVSRDRVLFISEEPIPLLHITDTLFNIRKKDNEFRIFVSPEGRTAASPTIHCGPDLSKTPKKNAARKTIILRAPTIELKAVWQNLLQRQILYINAGMEGSSLSSPLESPDVPITSSVATLQSAESLSLRRQTPQNLQLNQNNNSDMKRQLDVHIQHKCNQISRNEHSSKSSNIHIEKWMNGQFDAGDFTTELEPLSEEWTPERLRKRSEELHLIDCQGNIICRNKETKRSETINEENHTSDIERSPSRSTSESQVTVRSSPILPESLPVCRQCHKNCLTSTNSRFSNGKDSKTETINKTKDEDDSWGSLFLMGLSAVNPAAGLVHADPFIPNSKNCKTFNTKDEYFPDGFCKQNCQKGGFSCESTPDDSPISEEHPYHSLSSSNLTIRRFGTVPSLEKLGTDDGNSDKSSENDDLIENGTELSWTTKAGLYVAGKMAFLEKLSEDYKGGFFQRYLKSDNQMNGDDYPEEETSGGTSGEDIWGTPTSGGELDDLIHSPNFEGKQSPNDGSISSDYNEDTELMMDELLMTPPITGAIIRGLLPRRTLEPLIEEDISDSNSSTPSITPTDPSSSSVQDSEPGNAADTYSVAVESPITQEAHFENPSAPSDTNQDQTPLGIPRSLSYRKIIEAAEEEDNINFFNKFKPIARFTSIEGVSKSKGSRIFQFFNMRKMERRINEVYPENKEYISMFDDKCDNFSDGIPLAYLNNATISSKTPKEKQLDRTDRRFWKQLSKRRENRTSKESE